MRKTALLICFMAISVSCTTAQTQPEAIDNPSASFVQSFSDEANEDAAESELEGVFSGPIEAEAVLQADLLFNISPEEAGNIFLKKMEQHLSYDSFSTGAALGPFLYSVNGQHMYRFEWRNNTNPDVAAIRGRYYVDCETGDVYEYHLNHDTFDTMELI